MIFGGGHGNDMVAYPVVVLVLGTLLVVYACYDMHQLPEAVEHRTRGAPDEVAVPLIEA